VSDWRERVWIVLGKNESADLVGFRINDGFVQKGP
jgi:hypothetical protein